MRTLKGYIKNNARPEGCIAERYIAKECLNFYSMYLNDIDTMFNRVDRNNDMPASDEKYDVFSCTARPLGGYSYELLSKSELDKIHSYVLNSCSELSHYVKWVQKNIFIKFII